MSDPDNDLEDEPEVYDASDRHDDEDWVDEGEDRPKLQVAWKRVPVAPGERKEIRVPIAETYTGVAVEIPIFVICGEKPGPTVAITAAVHGDEINGTGTIRRIINNADFKLLSGTLVLVPVVNLMGFERHSRYLPDRRDLNRSFPGSFSGSLAARMAWWFFQQVTKGCDYAIDLHTAAVRRTNFPNVRADMSDPDLAAFARAFGAELIVSGSGPDGSLRRSACKAGCKTLILEAGEVWKVEPSVLKYADRGISNCLKFLGMIEGDPVEPAYRIETDATRWIRARQSGFLTFHVAPGDIVHPGDPIATCRSLFGKDEHVLHAPRGGVILGMTTLPSVTPGDPVCHLAFESKAEMAIAEAAVAELASDSLHEKTREDLATSMVVEDVKPTDDKS